MSPKYETVPKKIITWEEMVAHEPRLDELLAELRTIKADEDGYFCRHMCYIDGWKGHASIQARMDKLVGWYSRHEDTFLGTEQAWNLALETFLDALPPCHHCGCVDSEGYFV